MNNAHACLRTCEHVFASSALTDLEARERQAEAQRQEELQTTLREQEVRRSIYEMVLTKYR